MAGVLTRLGLDLPVDSTLLSDFSADLSFDYDAGLLSAPRVDASIGNMRVSAPIQAIVSPSGRMTFETLEAARLTDPSLNKWLQGMALGLPSDPEIFGATRLQTFGQRVRGPRWRSDAPCEQCDGIGWPSVLEIRPNARDGGRWLFRWRNDGGSLG